MKRKRSPLEKGVRLTARALQKILDGEAVLNNLAILDARVIQMDARLGELEDLVLKALHMRPRKEKRDSGNKDN